MIYGKKITLKEIIDTKSSFELKIINRAFADETIQPLEGQNRLYIYIFSFGFLRDSTFTNIQFVKARFESGSFNNCRFENCIFNDVSFSILEINQCVFINCQFIDSCFDDINCYNTNF